MRLSDLTVKRICEERAESLSALLARARVSRNAYYSLARRRTLLPGTLARLGAALGVRPEALLTAEDPRIEEMNLLTAEADRIARQARGVDRDTVRHVLLLLRKAPLDRLRKALVRSR